MFWAAHLAPARHSPQVGARARTSRGAPWSALNRASSWLRSFRSVTARPAGRVAPGAKVTVGGALLDGPMDGGPPVMRAAIRAKASRHAAANPSRPRRLIAGPRQAGQP